MKRVITVAGNDWRNFDVGDAIVVTSLWPSPRWWRLLKWATRRPLTTTSTRRAPTFREAWRGIVEERSEVVHCVGIGGGGGGGARASMEIR